MYLIIHTYFVSGTVLNIWHGLFQFISSILSGRFLVILSLQMREEKKNNVQKMKTVAQKHSTRSVGAMIAVSTLYLTSKRNQ